jgi:hypothetical protein
LATRTVIAFEHFGQVGAAEANISGRDKIWRIFLVELPIRPNPILSCVSVDSASRALHAL